MNKAVILAGGLGSRLKPFTEAIPKPLLPIGEKAVLEIQIERLKHYGIEEVFIATNYKSNYIESFIGDGSRLGVRVHFSKEEEPLGTCGPLSLLKEQLTSPFILMNGDILSTIDFGRLAGFAENLDADFTVVTKNIKTPFAFGSVKTKGNYLVDVEEKPDLVLEIVAGIYFMKPAVFRYIPDNTYFGIDNLIKAMIGNKAPIGRYLMHEYWLDIGRVEDYNEAQSAYLTHFKEQADGPL